MTLRTSFCIAALCCLLFGTCPPHVHAAPNLPFVRTAQLAKDGVADISLEATVKELSTILTSSHQSAFLQCTSNRVRKDVRDMTTQEVADWRESVLAVNRHRLAAGDSAWDRISFWHEEHFGQAHGSPYFLPWHRLFLLLTENIMRLYRPNAFIPFWDWTADAANPAMSAIWGSNYLGRSLRPGGIIFSGAFRAFRVNLANPTLVRRGFRSGLSGALGTFQNADHIDGLVDEDSFESFYLGLEVAHNQPHSAVGGDMATARSPNDPLFYVHHAFIDYIYRERQLWAGDDEFSADPNTVLNLFQRPASAAFSLDCVQYQSYSQTSLFTFQRMGVRSNSTRKTEVRGETQRTGREQNLGENWLSHACESKKNRMGMSVEQCKRGVEVLKGLS